jgi:AraC-like DNA-binding protein
LKSDYLKTNTIEALAMEVGFSSYSPFFSSFKNITGLAPLEYIKTMQ